MATHVTIFMVARSERMVTGLWCQHCLLPSGFELPFDRISEHGVTINSMTLRQCHDCERPLPAEDQP